ncbi:LysR family transcriptional regulator [Virgibacillus sp. YIM 98842]|uniref:LysR family transcriptional regulator n=1 Tax=Virgibacillus sp. YIM 98842 TaxID=2663533 RepID=UPI0013DC3493|nr:LysR family transcriptional regulator [Virgibacillus sp. YIM 98842]
MNLQQLKILVLIEEHKQVTAVANMLEIKQPTVTFHMKKLEESAGVPLFHQHHRKVFLTDAGRKLYDYAKRIVIWLEEAEGQMYEYREMNKGRVLIGASNTAATYFLMDGIGVLHKKFPNVHISLEVENTPLILKKLKNYALDFAIVAAHGISDPEYMAFPLMKDELGVVMNADHPLAELDELSVEMLQDQKWILREKDSSSRRMIDRWQSEMKVELDVKLELGSTEAIKKAIQSNLGLSILSKLSMLSEIKSNRLIYKEIGSPLLKRNIFLVHHRDAQKTPMVKQFVDYFRERGDGATV